MSDLMMWSLLIGSGMPPLIAVVQQPQWPSWLRTVVMLVICTIAGLATTYFKGDFHTTDIIGSLLAVAVAALTFYEKVWKKLGVTQRIEHSTAAPKHRKGTEPAGEKGGTAI